MRRTNPQSGSTRCRPSVDSSACIIPSKARSDSSFQTRAFLDPFWVSSWLPLSMAVMGACILGIHLDIPGVVVAEPQLCSNLGHRLALLPVLGRSYLSRHGLPLPIANYVAGKDHFAYRDGGLVTAARTFVSNQQVQHSGDVPFMCLEQLIVAQARVF